MGDFVEVSAFRGVGATRAATAIEFSLAQHGVRGTDLPVEATNTPPGQVSIGVWSDPSWTVVSWPMTFPFLLATTEMSRILTCVAVASDIYDGDLWRLMLVDSGLVLDRFCSDLGYFGREEYEKLVALWSGKPLVVAEGLGVDASAIAHYYRQPARFRKHKPLRGDSFGPADPWRFTDLWRRAGISYPSTPPDIRIEISHGFASVLPSDTY